METEKRSSYEFTIRFIFNRLKREEEKMNKNDKTYFLGTTCIQRSADAIYYIFN